MEQSAYGGYGRAPAYPMSGHPGQGHLNHESVFAAQNSGRNPFPGYPYAGHLHQQAYGHTPAANTFSGINLYANNCPTPPSEGKSSVLGKYEKP